MKIVVLTGTGVSVATCEIDLEPSANTYVFDERHYGPASAVVPRWVERVPDSLPLPRRRGS